MNENNVIATPPGFVIKNTLDEQKITIKEFSEMMNLSLDDTISLLTGELELTNEIALKLEKTLNISNSFWLHLESIYRERLLIQEKSEE